MAGNINRVIITGNLTRDPELRSLPSGTSVCELRVACNGRRRNAEGKWEDDPNYFNVTVWGQQGENCQQVSLQGPRGGDRWASALARMGNRRTKAPGCRYHR